MAMDPDQLRHGDHVFHMPHVANENNSQRSRKRGH